MLLLIFIVNFYNFALRNYGHGIFQPYGEHVEFPVHRHFFAVCAEIRFVAQGNVQVRAFVKKHILRAIGLFKADKERAEQRKENLYFAEQSAMFRRFDSQHVQ